MRTVQWQRCFEGMRVSQLSYAWAAGETLSEPQDQFSVMQAATRRPVRARLREPLGCCDRLGRIVLTPAGGCISVEASGEETDFPVRNFEFDPGWLTWKVRPEIVFDFGAATAQPVFDDPIIAVTLDRIYHEVVSPRPDSNGLVDCLLGVLAIDLARTLRKRADSVQGAELALTAEQLATVQWSIETTHFAELTPAKIAADCRMSLPRLREAFRSTTGGSLREQIEKARMNTARQLLEDSSMPLKVIAHELGFSHSSAFCYSFKSATGLTPTEYRTRRGTLLPHACA